MFEKASTIATAADGLIDALGETEALGDFDGLRLADGERDGLIDALGETDGLRDGLLEALGDLLGLTDGLTEGLRLGLMLGLIDADGLTDVDGDTEADGDVMNVQAPKSSIFVPPASTLSWKPT